MKLNNAAAVVTGASSGLGLALTRDFIGRGATVFGLARRADRLDAARAELGERFVPIACDVSDEQSVSAAFQSIADHTPRIDILVNNAGLGRFGPVEELPLDEWDLQMNTNLRGVFLVTRAVLATMKRQNVETGFGGHIVNIASVAALLGNPKISAYNATKFGLRGFTESLMKEVRNDGIKVTCVYPGSLETEFFDVAGVPICRYPMTAEDVASTIVHVVEAPDNYLVSEVVMRPLRPN